MGLNYLQEMSLKGLYKFLEEVVIVSLVFASRETTVDRHAASYITAELMGKLNSIELVKE